GDHVEERRLARAVRTDQAVDRALAHLEVTRRERLHAAVGLRHAGYLEQCAHRATPATPPRTVGSGASSGTPLRRPRQLPISWVTLGTTPRGSSRITARNSTPYTIR